MKQIKIIQMLLLASVLATSDRALSSSGSVSGAPKPPTAAKPTGPITAPKGLDAIVNSRKAEVASRHGSGARAKGAVRDAVLGEPGARDSLTNRKTSAKDAVDSLSLATPETQIKKSDGTALDLSSKKDINTKDRGLSDVTSNYLRNAVSRDVKITKRFDESKTSEYKDFAQAGDKIVERWSKDKKTLLDVKIESPDGSYRILDNSNQRGQSQGKILSARTADGKIIENFYYADGIIKQSIVTTPRTLNLFESNSIKTRDVTDYNIKGEPTKTVTYKESIGGNSTGKIIAVKEYTPGKPLEYELYNREGDGRILLEKREETIDGNNRVLTTSVRSSSGEFNPKQIIILDANNNIISIKTMNNPQNPKDKSGEKITFTGDTATKTITNKAGRIAKEIMSEGDQLTIMRVQESLNFNGLVKGTTASRVKVDNQGTQLLRERTGFVKGEFDGFKSSKELAAEKVESTTKTASLSAEPVAPPLPLTPVPTEGLLVETAAPVRSTSSSKLG